MPRLHWIGLLGLALVQPAMAACGAKRAELMFEFVSTPPLLVAEADASTIVQIDTAGCAVVHLPAHDVRRGDYRLQLSATDREALDLRLDAANWDRIDANTLAKRATHGSNKAGAPLFAIRDENLNEFWVGKRSHTAKAAHVRVARLRQGLAYNPGDSEFTALDGLRAFAEGIADQAHRAGVQP